MYKEIHAVYFDLGGVYYTEGFHGGLIAMADKHGLDPEDFYRTASDIVFESGYVRGEAPESLFWDLLARASGIDGNLLEERDTILSAFKPFPGMRDLAARIREQVPLGLLTDQCNWLYELDDRDGLLTDFDAVVNSYEEGYTKRDMEIFRIACQRFGLLPEEVIFFDDNPDNIDRASEFGMRAFVFEDAGKAERILAAEGVEIQPAGSGSGLQFPGSGDQDPEL